MTNVIVNKDKDIIKSILIKGHSGYEEKGKDILCSSISSMVILAIEIIKNLDDESLEYEQEDALIKISNMSNNETVAKILDTLVRALEDLAKDYPKNVKIEMR